MKLSDLFIISKLSLSRNDFKNSLNGLYINNKKITEDREFDFELDTVGDGKFTILRKGKKNYLVVKWTEDDSLVKWQDYLLMEMRVK